MTVIRPAREVADGLVCVALEQVDTRSFGDIGGEQITADRLRLVEWLRDEALAVQAHVPPLLGCKRDGKLIATVSLAAASLIHSLADELERDIRAAGGTDE